MAKKNAAAPNPTRLVQRVVTFYVTGQSHVVPDAYRDLFGNNRVGGKDGLFIGWALKTLHVVPGNGVRVFGSQALVALLVAVFEAPAGTAWDEQRGGA